MSCGASMLKQPVDGGKGGGEDAGVQCSWLARLQGYGDPASRVSRVLNGYLYLAILELLDMAEKDAQEGSSKEEAKRGILNHMCMDFEWDAGDLHG
jgi:hypothetical protein